MALAIFLVAFCGHVAILAAWGYRHNVRFDKRRAESKLVD